MFQIWIKKFKNWLKEDIMFKLSFSLIIILSFVLLEVNNITESLKEEIIKERYEQTFQILETGLQEYEKRLEIQLDHKVDLLIERTELSYSDPDLLKKDIDTLDYNSNFVKIVRKIISNDENILLVSADRVLMGNFNSYNMNSVRNNDFFNISMDEFYENFHNDKLVKHTMERIFALEPLKDDMLLGFEKNTSNLNLKKFYLDEILELIKNNPSKINDLYFISCSYITDTGDIFNTLDYDAIGNPNENMKMVLIKLFSFSDLDNAKIKNQVERLTIDIDSIETTFDSLQDTNFYLLVGCIFYCSFISIIISIEYYRNKDKQKN